ncbi:helix-turn-helix transcriptional regulator [Burkholderia vietnamiensis]|uniref:helix-turn-helix transcriptional regulator n=1 Tax=Burkholderia vietnamiensis TaxID=60552 RepID=UPI0009C1A1C4|nr:helix-turn-helix transcriptional regulator [Burkholderia vietnamiensis]
MRKHVPGPQGVGELLLLGNAVRQLRKGKCVSQEELAHMAGLDRSHMGRIERGERNVSVVNLLKVAHALGIPLSEIFRTAGL